MLERWARRPKSGQALALRCRIVLAAAGGEQTRRSRPDWVQHRHRWQVARAVREAGPRRTPRRAAAGPAALDRRRRHRVGDRQDARGAAAGRDPLVDALDGPSDGDESDRDQPHLARLRGKAPPDRGVHALARPAVHRQGARHRGALPQPARRRRRALRRREVPDPGARPLGPGLAVDAWGAPAPHPRLRSPRHHQPLRGARRRLGDGDRRHLAAPSRRGVPPLPEPDRRLAAGAPRRARRARQLLHPQDAIDPALASAPPARFTLHFTPTYSSWINLVERWFAEPTTKWLKRSAHRSVRDLTDSIRAWTANWNEDPKPYTWHKTADEILTSLASYCQRISDSGD